MKKLFVLLLKFSIPLIGVALIYIWADPFKVIWHYNTSFYETNTTVSISMNKDYVSTATYDNHFKDKKYDSFIFGNSRSIIYEISEWKKYIPENSSPYHFDASAETIYGISKKIQYIDSKNEKINNALLVLDHMILNRDKSLEGHSFVISPQLTNYKNLTSFHFQFFKASLSHEFLPGYLEYKITGNVKPYMYRGALNTEDFLYDSITNEMRYTIIDKEIASGKFYTAERMKVFYKRGFVQEYAPAVIQEKQKMQLGEIAEIFKRQGTKYKIIISPLYDQKKLNAADMAYLIKMFGSGNIYDFSGINSITNDYRNYYESSHYRPHVATSILEKAYAKK
ncbi:hypothetical protein ACX0HA_11490 [Flavobacterium hauense]